MSSVRRLARLLASLDVARPREKPSPCPPPPADGDAISLFEPMSLIVQKGGSDRGGLARVDSLGLVLRIKRPVDDGACVHG